MRERRPLTILLAVLALAAGIAGATGCGDDAEQASGTSTAEQARDATEQASDTSSGTSPGSTSPDAPKKSRSDSDQEDRDADTRDGKRPATKAYSPDPATPEGQVNTTITDIYDALGDGSKELDAKGLCDLMTPRAQRQTTRYAEVSSGVAKDWNCELAVGLLVDRNERTGGKPMPKVEVLGVNVEGDRATATIRFGRGPATSLALGRHDGEWKLDGAPSGG